MKTNTNKLTREQYINKYWDITRSWRSSPLFIKEQLKREMGQIWDKYNNLNKGAIMFICDGCGEEFLGSGNRINGAEVCDKCAKEGAC